jgi:UDP-3-O-[3-hydroxymyristoyl] glucosamine N-acyltransferase
MNKNLLILGAGMFGTVVKELAKDMGVFEKIDFLDDKYGSVEFENYYNEQVIGKLDDYEKFLPDYEYAIVSIGNPDLRMEWTKKLYYGHFKIPIIVSQSAYVSESAQLSRGVIVGPMAVINSITHIGEGTFVLAKAVVDHNSFVADYCNIQCGTVVMPGAAVPSFIMTQPNEVVRKNEYSFTLGNHNGEAKFVGERIEITNNGNVEG